QQFDVALGGGGDFRGRQVVDLAVTAVIAEPGEKADHRHRQQRPGPGFRPIDLEGDGEDQRMRGSRQPPRALHAGAADHARRRLSAPDQELNSCLTSTSFFSSSENSSSCASLKFSSRATITSGNCSMRTLLTLTDSL